MSILLKFLIFAAIGVLGEVVFTALSDFFTPKKNKWDLKGHSYIWMAPIYGLGAFLCGPTLLLIKHQSWIIRGCFYALIIMGIEYLAGILLREITGRCPWDYRGRAKLHVHGLVRLDYAIVWFCVGFIGEYLILNLK